jgi:hypothetical protein
MTQLMKPRKPDLFTKSAVFFPGIIPQGIEKQSDPRHLVGPRRQRIETRQSLEQPQKILRQLLIIRVCIREVLVAHEALGSRFADLSRQALKGPLHFSFGQAEEFRMGH